jgi:primosomal protein N' (replication factor Y) (superfamily II helicase)
MENELLPFFEPDETTLFVDVILPVPLPRLFTYRVPRVMTASIKIGARVIVQFGKNRIVTAVVGKIHNQAPDKYQAKYLLELLDEDPLVIPLQIELFQWIADYYMCSVGEVMNVALPAGLKVTSQSKMQFNPEFENNDLLTEEEAKTLEEIKNHQSLTYDELAKIVGEISVTKLIKSLVSKRAIIIYEEVKERYKPKIQKKVRLKKEYCGSVEIENLISSLSKSAKQQDIILEYMRYVPFIQRPDLNKIGLEKSVFTQGDTSDSALDTLIKKGIFETFEVVVSRFAENSLQQDLHEIVLSPHQEVAVGEIMTHFESKDVVMLHGITGSGKTEVYIDLIQKVLQSGTQVLFLLPEIALTTQIVSRLRRVFGDKLGIYHSKFSDNERVEVWRGVIEGRFQLVVGVRSSIFLPFNNLGLIIIDEEHETSYKQYDPAPRYHARDAALMIAYRQSAKVLLGSATPSMESFFQAKTGKYGLVAMTERYGEAQLPDFQLVDMKAERKAKTLKIDFSSVLFNKVNEKLSLKEQVILFQNRRGYSPYMNCQDCNWIGQCDHCAVSLTYHMGSAELRCHYCGHKEQMPRVCPACGSGKIKSIGYGTEKIEDDVKTLFPTAGVLRMDLDTTRSKNAYQQIISEFETGNTDILVGTQMISKGLDFDRVSLVGVFDADRIIHFPDFRAAERAFQLITQVSGRAGRRGKKGLVVVQTGNTNQSILTKIVNNDYLGFYDEEIIEREAYHYPPFMRLISLTVKHEDPKLSEKAAEFLANKLAEKLTKERILGPERALIPKIRNLFLFDILIKLEREGMNIKAAKTFIREQIDDLLLSKAFKGLYIVADVDAM